MTGVGRGVRRVGAVAEPTTAETAFPTLTETQLARIEPYGQRDEVDEGDYVFVEGQPAYDFVVILDGEIEILSRAGGAQPEVVAAHGAGRFLGELSLLTGQSTTLAGRARRQSTVLKVAPDRFRALMSAETDLADLIFDALAERRQILQRGAGSATLRIFGSRFNALALELGTFVRRNRLPYQWIDVDADERGVDAVLAEIGAGRDDLPMVVTPTATLRRPTTGELAAHLGLSYTPQPGRVFDVAVIGGGPAGLAAAVYGASEGLDTILVDAVGVGGQAGTSSRIENYLGFPSGVSGGELVERAAIQAQRLGATISAPCRVAEIGDCGATFLLVLGDREAVPARTIVLATGVRYRKLPIDDLEAYEGAGVYYAATELEAATCAAGPVTVVGGGNSAGQAAIFLAQRGSSVRIAIRGDDLAASMSTYLIDRIEASPAIEVTTSANVVGLGGTGHLEQIDLDIAGEVRTVPCVGLFSFIGADPATDWLPDAIRTDAKGFVLTDRSLPDDVVTDPLPFETSWPGVFAAGDVRVGSMKRVAAAVGEGSSVIRSVHDHLSRATAGSAPAVDVA